MGSNFIFIKVITLTLGFALTCNKCDATLQRLPMPTYKNGDSVFFPRIVGGTPAALGEFPGKLSIQNRRGSHFCGGTLINSMHAVTAAHCVTDYLTGRVINPTDIQLMGDDIFVGSGGSDNRQTRVATHIFVHVNFSLSTLINDIAVIRVAEPFFPSPTFHQIQRAASTPPINITCSVAGWGATVENGTGSVRLMRVNIAVIDPTICNRRNSYEGSVITPGMICAGRMTGGQDACQGDSGGGLICNGLLAGVVSWGYGCARPNYPGIYSDVSVNNAFIDSALIWSGGSQINVPTPTTVRPGAASTIYASFYLFVVTFLLVLHNN